MSNELGAGNPKSAVFSVVVVTVLSAVLHPVGAHLGGHPPVPGLHQLHLHRGRGRVAGRVPADAATGAHPHPQRHPARPLGSVVPAEQRTDELDPIIESDFLA